MVPAVQGHAHRPGKGDGGRPRQRPLPGGGGRVHLGEWEEAGSGCGGGV